MKKLILIALASLSIISCRKDDDEKDESMIIGTWNLTKIQIISGKDNAVLSSELVTDCPDKRQYLFSENKYTLNIFKDNFIGSCVVDDAENGDFHYNDLLKTITFTSTRTGNPYKIAVNYISNNELFLIDSFFNYDANNDGTPDKSIMVFNR